MGHMKTVLVALPPSDVVPKICTGVWNF